MTKMTIKETEYLSIEDFGGSIDEVITKLQEIKEDGWEGIEVWIKNHMMTMIVGILGLMWIPKTLKI